jgi:hypothetical protein
VLYLVLTWIFQQYFDVDETIITFMLKLLLWYALFETIFIMVVSRIFWVFQKARDFQEGKIVVDEIDSQSIQNIGKDLGIELTTSLASTVKDMIVKTPEEKQKKALEKLLAGLEGEYPEEDLE